MNDFEMRLQTAKPGKTWLFSVGQAGFILKSRSGQLLGIDMYLSDCVERVEGNAGYKRLLPKILNPSGVDFDAIIATHFHKDHFDDDSIPELLSNKSTVLYAAYDCTGDVQRLGLKKENVIFVKPGDVWQNGDFTMEFVSCDHGKGAPKAVGVIVNVDGKRIYEAGDTCLRTDRVDEVVKNGPIDVMLAPINGMFGNMSAEDCAKYAEAVKPGLVIPCHYGMFASHMGSVGEFYEIMTTKYPENKFKIMAYGEIAELF